MYKNKVFVIGDVHGKINMMKELLKKWDEKEEQLVILGDLGDRGENSKQTFELAYHLSETKDAIVVKGNHDDMLEKYLENPDKNKDLYYMNGGETTVDSLLEERGSTRNHQENAEKIKNKYPWLLSFLKSLPYFYEWENYLFVHAGVDLTLKDWKDSSQRDFIWIREGFYDQKNTTDKTIIFGHTVTSNLHDNLSKFDIWQSGDGLIGIDGGAVYGGQMHALVISKDGIEKEYSVSNQKRGL